jgi:hypothetical protein
MRSSVISKVVLVGLVAGLASVYGCRGGKPIAGGTAGNGVGGSGGMAGSMAAGTTGAAGSSTAGASGGGAGGGGGLAGSNAGGTGGAAGSSTGGASGTDDGGASGSDGGGGSGGLAGSTDGGVAGAIGAGLGFGGSDITKIVPTTGCGMDPGQAIGIPVRYTIQTSGTKAPDCADSNCAPWSYLREYYLRLPTGYDNTKAYPVIIEAPGSGGTGLNLYALPDLAGTAIRVGLSPPPIAIGHATNPGQGSFDDAEGDDSVEWPFLENLYDLLARRFCFDRNRVFAAGSQRGGIFATEIACKYAGDPTRPVRAALSNSGGLIQPMFVPTCTTNPTAGMWVNQIGNGTRPFTFSMAAITRAMAVNRCTIGTGYADAQFENFPIGGMNPDTTCQKVKGCPELYPLVVCALPGNDSSGNEAVANPGFSTFIKLFSAPPLLPP